MRSLSLQKKIILGYVLPTSLAIAASVLVYRALLASITTGERVNRTNQVIAFANVAIRSAVEAEGSERGFGTLGDDRMLQRYNEALKTFDKTARKLADLEREHPQQTARLDQARSHFARWVAEVAAPVIAARRMTPAGLAAAADLQLILVLQLRRLEEAQGHDPAAARAWTAKLGEVRTHLEASMRLLPSDLVRWMRLGTLANQYEAAVQHGARDFRDQSAKMESIAAALAAEARQEETRIAAALADGGARAGLDPFRMVIGEFVDHEHESLERHRQASEAAVRSGKTVAIAGPGLAGALALFLAIALSLGIIRSVRSVAIAAQALMSGDSEQRARAATNDEIGVMARTFNLMADRLSARNREMALLSQFGGLLAACTKLDEAYDVISRLLRQLLPHDEGALYVVGTSRRIIERAMAWGAGGEALAAAFSPEECWAVRRGQPHVVAAGSDGVACAHATAAAALHQVCIPLIAQGEVLSVLCLRLSPGGGEPTAGAREALAEKLRLATAAAEPIAMALANLKLRETLQNQSIRDPLTGLYNRRFLQETFAKELSRVRRHERPLGVIVLDVDHFKRFNDTFGHAAGDTLLAAVGKLLAASFRHEDIVCRYGGEEFVMVLPYASLEDTARRAEGVRAAIARLKLQHQGTPLGPVTASLGVAAFPQQGDEEAALIEAADAALYRAKHAGRDRVEVASVTDLTAIQAG
jgi:diguanylate cyclase (GGDEF)-like protein